MGRHLPAVRRSARTLSIGRPGSMSPLEEFSYEALVLSEPHWRLRPRHRPGRPRKLSDGSLTWSRSRVDSGGWSGGGPFYAFKMGVEHKGLLRLPYSAYGIEGPWSIAGVHPGLDGLPSGWNAGTDPVAYTPWPLLVDGLRDLYAEGYRRARPGSPEADLGVFLAEIGDLPSVPLLQEKIRGVAQRLLSGAGGVPKLPPSSTRAGFAGAIRGLRDLAGELAALSNKRGAEKVIGLVRDYGAAAVYAEAAKVLRGIDVSKAGNVKALPRAARLAASEHLNLVFGWIPFVSDLRKIANTTLNLRDILKKIVDDNGKWRKKAVSVRNDTVTEVTRHIEWGAPYFGLSASPPDFPIKGRTLHKVTRTTKTEAWWEGQFRYWIPPLNFDSWLWQGMTFLHLYGAFPTPKVIYNATPWSWLVEWWAGLDTILANISPNAVDNLVLRYGFLMEHVTVTTVASSHVVHPSSDDSYPGVLGFFWPAVDHEFRSIYTVEKKMRIGNISPFGSLKYGDSASSEPITPRRAAVLASLGITSRRN